MNTMHNAKGTWHMAMAAGVTTKLWEVSDLVALLEAAESKKAA